MPSFTDKREWLRRAIVATTVLTAPMTVAWAADAPRLVSINACTDQLLMLLADPDQIVGLSPYSRDAQRSWAAANARAFPLLSGEAEDVLMLKPDIVVAGRFTKRATRELLKEKGLRVVEFDTARSLADIKSQMTLMGELAGHAARARDQIAQLDAAVARVRETVARKPYRVLAVSRRGWVSGGNSLTSALLSEAGLSNAASEMGLKSGGFASLETIIKLKPDFIMVSDSGDFAEDQGRAFLLHPALERLYPEDRRIVMPERLTVCGGPMFAEALDRLADRLKRIER